MLRGIAFNKLGQYATALKHLEAYRDLLGDDEIVCVQLANALYGLKRYADGARVYRQALDLNPKNVEAFQGLLHCIGGGDKLDDVGARFAKLDNLRENFDVFVADCEQRQFPALLEPIVLSMHRIDPDYPPVDYYLSLTKARAQQVNEAVRLFKSALARQPDEDKRKHYCDGFVKAMASVGKLEDAYTAVPDARSAFPVLVAEALKHYRLDQLKRLTAVHAQKFADDPLLPWCQAAVQVSERRYALADKTYAAALAKPPDDETLGLFRYSRVQARYQTGQILSAYRDIGPRGETFSQLANLCLQEERYDQLQLLLDVHATDEPESIEALQFRLRLLCRQDKVPDAIALFKMALAKPLPMEQCPVVVSVLLYEAAEAGKSLEAYRAAPDAKAAFRQLAGILLDSGQVEELRRIMDVHRLAHPADSWLTLYQADLHLREEAWDKVVELLAARRNSAPKEVAEDFRWRYVLALYKSGRAMQAYAETEAAARNQTWNQLANLMDGDKKEAELPALIAAHRPHAINAHQLDYFEARVAVRAKQPVEAMALLQKACRNPVEEWERNMYVSGILTEMIEEGLSLEGYRAWPDKAAAFETLANSMVFQKKADALAALLEEHGKGRAADPLFQYYTGELHLLRGDAQQAEPHFTAAVAAASPQDPERFRTALYRANVKTGNAVRVYQQNGTGSQWFEYLAYYCVQEKDGRQLQALIDAHRKVCPDDPNLPTWDVEARWLNKDYEGVLKLLTANRAEFFAASQLPWKCEDFLVRGLVRLKRTEEAIREAETLSKKRSANRALLILAHAAAGDVKQTLAVVQKLHPKAYELTSCYQDEDLGPMLRSAAFREVREKFPEPKQQQWHPDDD